QSSISSPTRSGPVRVTPARLFSSSCAASHRARRPNTWLKNSALIARTCWSVGIRFKRSSKSAFPPSPLPDPLLDVKEMYQNGGEKGRKHLDPLDPPRRRANKVRGHGNWETDRPAVAGVVGRETGEIRLEVCRRSDRATLQPFVEATTRKAATINSD